MTDEERVTDGPASGASADQDETRVLALLDASRQSLAALSAAVALADDVRAELVALFVEDLDLIHCAAFPFSREVGASTGLSRPLSRADLEASLARQVQRVTQAVEAAVAGRELRHRLQVSRGQVVSEALAQAGPGDVLVLGKAGLSARWGARLGSTSHRLILEAPCTVIIWDERHPPSPGPLRYFRGQAPRLPWGESLEEVAHDAPLFRGREELAPMGAEQLERFLARSRSGALLVSRERLSRLIDQEPDVLARIPIPVIVVP
ncbi:nucleotide-binding universal stress UspA family protein [Halomonas campaniensis]|uniref:Nucleotide-binding universal stress UspA family protein n=1 Tax=Halomonas campaniensis TaxID=213554 RepID=A0A7W5K405_9GAMM|nr:universal stress protein [Halomonas campaniensis]MBB3330962.1 nucleotide-binding universal stress UspA family protein [Halomonas campaniensis]